MIVVLARLRLALLSAVIGAFGWGVSAAVAEATPLGTLSGTVTGIPTGAPRVVGVSAIDLSTGRIVTSVRATRSGAFSVSLPRGGYAIAITVTPVHGNAASATTGLTAVSLRAGQHRRNVRLTSRGSNRRRRRTHSAHAGSLKAAAAMRQESGATQPGVAFNVEPFSGATGELAVLNTGLEDMLITALGQQPPPCPNAQVANAHDRALIEQELNLAKGPLFDPEYVVHRNFIVPEVTVDGTLTNGPADQSVEYRVEIRDASTGTVFETIEGSIATGSILAEGGAMGELVSEIGRAICHRPRAYEVQIDVQGTATTAAYASSGTMLASILATSATKAPQLPSAWEGTGELEWSDLVFTPKVPQCLWSPQPASWPWSAKLAVVEPEMLHVEWESQGSTMAASTVECVDAPPIGGQGGPALIGIGPLSLTLPLTGGTQPLSGGLPAAGGGWSETGTLTVVPAQEPAG